MDSKTAETVKELDRSGGGIKKTKKERKKFV
jgi:hypothetical protein